MWDFHRLGLLWAGLPAEPPGCDGLITGAELIAGLLVLS